ncbi:isoprenyl transferase [Winkia sp. UMB0889B]|uniref:isoprenyl transferase n=1 Tax=Winkia sp. UMB0889B TaxID=3046315 RepID=UPI002552EE8F|nr:isoprenyl transferase [Winkia sp. UMB0889B]MDK7906506.1 isoprenyl transferase [Winkia sp. UMB0889B]
MNEVAGPAEGERRVPSSLVAPTHVGIIMDGNGRWANARKLPRTEGHKRGEVALMDMIAGALEAGVRYLSVYAFSTENWKRSPAEVRFLMGYSRDILRKRRDRLHEWGVRVRWAGRKPKLWKSVITELQAAEELTKNNTKMDLVMCLNYGGRAELADAMNKIASRVAQGKLKPGSISEATVGKNLYLPDVPDVDLLIRSGGERRLSNFLLWQCAYAELAFSPKPWPEFRREDLWDECLAFAGRERRFGGAVDRV